MNWKKLISSVSAILLLSGCTSTQSVIFEYDSSGKLVKKTESQESVVSSLMQSTQHKTVIAWEDGWTAYISVSSGTTEDPTPHGKIFMGQVNKGLISLHPETTADLSSIATLIRATKTLISADLTKGVSGK